jgi:lipopolysaccharide assembly protein B
MEFEFWWLLAFPLFFVLGWLAARVDIRQVVTESRALPNSYFRGLNFLLNEQPDKAIEAFLEVVKLEPETIDLHFALGGCFAAGEKSTAPFACMKTCWSAKAWPKTSACAQ